MIYQVLPGDSLVEGFHKKPGISYVGLWLNDKGLKRAIDSGRLEVKGSVSLCASEPFLIRNQNRTMEENIPLQHKTMEMFKAHNVPVLRGAVMAAFGCNFAGDISAETVLKTVAQTKEIAMAHGYKLETMMLADTMAWATPRSIKRVVGAVQDMHPELDICLHLHDTRGMALAMVWAGLEAWFVECFQLGVESGFSPELMVMELYASGETAEIFTKMARNGFFRQMTHHSTTSQYGTLSRGPSLINDAMRARAREIMRGIQDGSFVEEWSDEQAGGSARLEALRAAAFAHPMSQAESDVIAAVQAVSVS